ncbi:MAG: putative metalloprotease CJM1_0395 family protein [Anaerolineae bacterium]
MKTGAIPQAYPISSYTNPASPSGSPSSPQDVEKLHDEFVRSGEAHGTIDEQGLTEEERKKVEGLKARDREVRAHEQAHLVAAGQYAVGGPSYQYETGPDGKRYAVGGEVRLDTSGVPDNPEATIRKMEQIQRAALAPRDPSSQDRRVATEAGKKEAKARQEVVEEKRSESQSHGGAPPASPTTAAERYSGSTKVSPADPLIDVVV